MLSSATLLAALAAPAAAHAQRTAQDIASARQLYNEGIELRDEGDLTGALEKLKAAHALGNTPITGLELCRLHSALRQPVEAREACLAVGRIPPLAEETARSKDARSDAARLAEAELAKIGALRLKVTGVPEGWQPTVIVDGAQVPAVALSEPRAVNPGAHTVVAKVGSGPETRATVEMAEGETKDVELAVQPPPEGAEPPPAAPVQPALPPEKKKNGFATGSFVVAGIAAGVGAIAGLVAISHEGDLGDACAMKICGRDQWDKLDTAETWGNVSTAMFVIGGVALGAGLVSTIASPSSKKASITPVIGLGGGGLRGSF